jgi:Leucine carboxyl methyltransferase
VAKPSGHGPALHPPVSRLHRGACSLPRGSGRGTGRTRRRAVRPARRGPGHVRPAQAGDRLSSSDIRGRPAWSSGLETAAPDRTRFGIPDWLRLVPVDFEAGDDGWQRLAAACFDIGQPAVVASTGVSMYLTKDAIAATLRQVAAFAPGSTLAMTFLLPLELADPEVRPGLELAEKGARASGTPFISFFTPAEMLALAREAGFREVQHVSAATLGQRYFAGRTDGLRPPNNSEELLVAVT